MSGLRFGGCSRLGVAGIDGAVAVEHLLAGEVLDRVLLAFGRRLRAGCRLVGPLAAPVVRAAEPGALLVGVHELSLATLVAGAGLRCRHAGLAVEVVALPAVAAAVGRGARDVPEAALDVGPVALGVLVAVVAGVALVADALADFLGVVAGCDEPERGSVLANVLKMSE